MAISPVERQNLLADLSSVAIRDLVELWRRATVADVDFAQFLIDAYPEIAVSYAEVAADLAADWYEQSAPDLPYQAVTAGPPPVDVLQKSTQWALGADGDKALSRLSGTLQRSVFDGARRTTLVNVEREGSKWVRYASANACAFCALLATRSAVYTSKQSATRVVGQGKDISTNFDASGKRKSGGQARGIKTRGSRKIGEKYHDHCHCVAVEVRPGRRYTPPPHVQEFKRAYKDAFDAVPDGMAYDSNNSVLKAVLSNMRSDLGSH